MTPARVACVGSSRAALTTAALLRRSGATVAWRRTLPHPPEAELVVALPAPGEVTLLDAWNETALAAGREWMQVLPWDGRLLAIGPVYVPGQTACFRCYTLRRAAAAGLGPPGRSLETVPTRARAGAALHVLAAAVAAEHALRWLARRDAALAGTVHALDVGDGLGLLPHLVLPVPLCPACGAGSAPGAERAA